MPRAPRWIIKKVYNTPERWGVVREGTHVIAGLAGPAQTINSGGLLCANRTIAARTAFALNCIEQQESP